MRHVAFMKPRLVDRVIAGERWFDVRLSRRLTPPANGAVTGDVVYLKDVGGDIRARALIKKVELHNFIGSRDVVKLYQRLQMLDKSDSLRRYFAARNNSRYGIVIWFDDVTDIHIPGDAVPSGRGKGWIVNFKGEH